MTAERKSQEEVARLLCGTRSFKGVGMEALGLVVGSAALRPIQAGEALFRPGDPYKHKVFIPLADHLLIRRRFNRDDSVLAGDLVGLANYLDNAPYASAALAVQDGDVLEVPAERLRELEQTQPDLFNVINRVIATKLRQRAPDRGISTGVLARPVTAVMKTPVASCGPDLSLRQAFGRMQERRIGSMVVADDAGDLIGVLTCAGLSEAALLKDASPDDSIMDAACQHARTVAPDTPLWEAEEIQEREGIKYLIVAEGDKAIGMVSQTDILRALVSQSSAITTQIPQARSVGELRVLFNRMAEVAAEARETNRRPSTAVRILSEQHLAVQRRVVELTLEWMRAEGRGAAPTGFAVLIMGSGGRKEMLMRPDQDNGLIIQDGPLAGRPESREWFEQFAQRLNRSLDEAGYILCPGEIMARNPMYRKSLEEWKRQIEHLVEQPNEKAAVWSNIVFDFDTLYGDDRLTAELRRHLLTRIQAKPRLLSLMVEHDAEGRPAIGWFNRLITTTRSDEGGRIDLKRNGLRIIADAARVFALQNGIAVQNTTDRLAALVRTGKFSDDFATSVGVAYDELLDLLLEHQIEQLRRDTEPDKLVDPDRLNSQQHGALRMAMRAVKRFQDRLQGELGTEAF
ncbi:MAG: putative nucleotidyltransferase substrate binding domain-containing protein [Chromatiales bacterium]|jgi:CBS domain-containing protein